jgi:2'-5' RNA ligase
MRLFTGLSIPDRVTSRLAFAIDELRPSADLAWSKPENLHITMKFVGVWPESRLPELQTNLAGIERAGSFEVTVSRFGFWPNPHQPTIFFAAVQPSRELHALARRIDDALSVLGCEPEKLSFTPHVTLARIRRPDIGELRERVASMFNMQKFEFGSFTPQEFHLYSSASSPAGSVYTKLSSYPLVRTA